LAVASIDGPTTNKIGVFAPQDEYFFVDSASFMNYGAGAALAGCNDCDSDAHMMQGGFTFRFNNLRFFETPHRVRWTEPYKQIFFDYDGTLTGDIRGTTTPFYAYNLHAGCRQENAQLNNGLACDNTRRVRKLRLDRQQPRELDFREIQMASTVGNASISFRPKDWYGWCVLVVEGEPYNVTWGSPVDFQKLSLRYSEPPYIERDMLMVTQPPQPQIPIYRHALAVRSPSGWR
jgi:hypothetical protein